MLLVFISVLWRFILAISALSLRLIITGLFVVIMKLVRSFTVIKLLVLALLATLLSAAALLLIAFIVLTAV
jgi:hypothetical protein